MDWTADENVVAVVTVRWWSSNPESSGVGAAVSWKRKRRIRCIPASTSFGETISLEAIQGPVRVIAGDPFEMTFVWSANGPTDEPLHTAVQLADADGELVGSGDGRPLGGYPSTDRWHEGEIVIAKHSISWVEDRAAGLRVGDRLALRLGWYQLDQDDEGGMRTIAVPSAAGEALVTVGTISVGASR